MKRIDKYKNIEIHFSEVFLEWIFNFLIYSKYMITS